MEWFLPAIFLLITAAIAGFLATVIARHMRKTWGIPTRHWQSWYLSLASFCVLFFFQVYASIPGGEGWRVAEIDRVTGWLFAAAILAGHAVAYFIVNSRPLDNGGQTDA